MFPAELATYDLDLFTLWNLTESIRLDFIYLVMAWFVAREGSELLYKM